MRFAVTGHRPNKLWGYDYNHPSYHKMGRWLRHMLKKHNAELAISGMALGVDQIFALVALKLDIPLESALPCQKMESRWSKHSKDLHHSILERASTVTLVTDEPYSPELMQIRNQYMVDNCDILIAVWDGSSGGTANCVRYAHSIGKKIIPIKPEQFEV